MRFVLVVLVALAAGCKQQPSTAWNSVQIRWQPFEAGLAAAARDKTPICLVISTEWCPHCTNYSRVFGNPDVVARSSRLVMIRVDADKDPEISRRYAPDGEYVPRTLFLSSDGAVDPSIHAPRNRSIYFYSESDPSSVLAGMDAALGKLH